LLEGREGEGGRIMEEEEGEEPEEEEESISEQEIREVVKRMKKRKAAGVDGNPDGGLEVRRKGPMERSSGADKTSMERRSNTRGLEERYCGAAVQERRSGRDK